MLKKLIASALLVASMAVMPIAAKADMMHDHMMMKRHHMMEMRRHRMMMMHHHHMMHHDM